MSIPIDVSTIELIGGGNTRGKGGKMLPLSQRELATLEARRRLQAVRQSGHTPRTGHEALSILGVSLEEVVRIWLLEQKLLQAARFAFDARSYLYFYGEDPYGVWRYQTLQLDAVSVDETGEPNFVFEFRVSSIGMHAVREKERQLRRSVGIMKHRWPGVQPLIVYIRVGDQDVETHPRSLMRGRRLQNIPLATAANRAERVAYDWIPRVVFDLGEILQFAAERGWDFNPELGEKSLMFAEHRRRRRLRRRAERA